MAIYTRWGNEVMLTTYHGKHQTNHHNHPMMLVSGQYKGEVAHVHYWFSYTLKADNGINEIDAKIDTLPEVELTVKQLDEAIKDAE